MVMRYEASSYQPDLKLPENIHTVIDESLIPAADLNAKHGNTFKYFVANHPDLFVRVNLGENSEKIQASLSATLALRSCGITVPKTALVERSGKSYVFTEKVYGSDLPTELHKGSVPAIIKEADITWSGLSVNLISQRIKKGTFPYDVEAPYQFMYGTTASDPVPHIRLVDLTTFIRDPMDDEDYVEECLCIANGIVEIEGLSKSVLSKARETLLSALTLVADEEEWVGKTRRATQFVLSEATQISPHLDGEFIFNTF